jgi:hypothetical protein
MHYVYLTDNVVTDQSQVDPYSIFTASYASQFIEAPDEVTFGWTLENGVWAPPPGPTPAQIQEQNKSTATSLLQETDWTCTVDITNPQYSNPYLTNQSDFLTYRSTVRNIAISPPITPVNFPDQPTPTWSN